MPIFLCGFMGCGKTTIGKKLADSLNLSYYDTDQIIINKCNMSIPDIFASFGEKYFREKESEVIEEASSYKGIISCGGGAMLDDKNAAAAKQGGPVIFLNVPFKACYHRISEDTNRPIVLKSTYKELENIYNERFPIYKKNSSMIINCCGSPTKITAEIINILEKSGEI